MIDVGDEIVDSWEYGGGLRVPQLVDPLFPFNTLPPARWERLCALGAC